MCVVWCEVCGLLGHGLCQLKVRGSKARARTKGKVLVSGNVDPRCLLSEDRLYSWTHGPLPAMVGPRANERWNLDETCISRTLKFDIGGQRRERGRG